MSQNQSIRILLVDDSADDRELILMNLRRGGYKPDTEWVDTRDGFEDALDGESWDLIICDYSMPGFDGLTALNILNERDCDIPFILVSGAIGEELAVKAMKAGATDYLMKDNLQRLVPAIERELKEAEIRQKHREAQQERDRLLTVIQSSLNEIYLFDCQTLRYSYLNQSALDNLGYRSQEILEMTPVDIIPDLEVPSDFNRILQPILRGDREKDIYFTKHRRRDGSTYPIEVHLQLIRQNDEQFFAAIGFDLSDREKDARRIKEQKEIAREFAEHSKHKSEFLANMSHELRTPLNSILLLSKLLLDQKSDNLSDDQRKFIDVIRRSGNNLLDLINEVLDLSKIESGEMEITFEDVDLEEVIGNIRNIFEPIAGDKNLRFTIQSDDQVPGRIRTDQLRVEQVLRNLLSNAMKFTEKGSVDLEIGLLPGDSGQHRTGSDPGRIQFRVNDTGIGIPADKQEIVFESFRQADGSTQRKFGGTGLGLAICKQLAHLLGGDLTLQSEPGSGSTFTLTLPAVAAKPAGKEEKKPEPAEELSQTNDADEEASEKLLLISRDPALASSFTRASEKNSISIAIAETGWDAIESFTGEQPAALFIDPYCPGVSGFSVAAYARRTAGWTCPIWMVAPHDKPMPETRTEDITGKIMDPVDAEELLNLMESAGDHQPAGDRTLLLVDDNQMHNDALREFAADVVDRCLVATSAKEAMRIAVSNKIDCMVLDLTLPDASGADLLKTFAQKPETAGIPVIIYSGRSLTKKEKDELLVHASDVIFKNVGSHSRLMNRISQLTASVTPHKPRRTAGPKTVLIADDDDQSYLALSSHLEPENLRILRARNGRETLKMLREHPDAGLLLLDVMMPLMDGFEVVRQIRSDAAMSDLPVIMVTAKAMRGDREECIELGATDYISKPIDTDKLDKLLAIWLPSNT